MAIDEVHLANLRDQFSVEWKKVEHIVSDRRVLTNNLNKRAEYRDKITKTFNAICGYLLSVYHASRRPEDKLECVARVIPYIDKCKRAFIALKLEYNWPIEELTLINVNSIQSLDVNLPEPTSETQGGSQLATSTENQGDVASSTGLSDTFVDANESRIDDIIHELSRIQTESDSETEQISEAEQQQVDQSDQIEQIDLTEQNLAIDQENTEGNDNGQNNQPNHILPIEPNTEQGTVTMPQSAQDFFRLAGSVLNYKYDGDPILRDSFIEDCELVESMAEEENKGHCLKFIKSKIIGRAREMLPEKIEKIEDMTNDLKAKVKADNSTVIEGRLTALRVNKGNFTKFSEEAEKLTDAFRRSLISEGFAKAKADEMTIKKTKELCRRIARNDSVKGIIATTVCDTPAEVIATLITETDIARKEKREQDSYQKRPNYNNNDNKNKNYKNNKGGKYNKNDQKGGYNQSQDKGKYNKNHTNDNGSGKNRGGRNEHTIRIVADGGTPSTSAENANNNGEQVFRLNQS